MHQRQVNSVNYPIYFLLVSSIDHVTGIEGLTPSVSLSKNGGAFVPAIGTINELG